MSVHIRGIGPDGQWLTKAERNDMSLSGISIDHSGKVEIPQRLHAMTCPHRSEAGHVRRDGMDLGQLVCDFRGMYCPDCDYRQAYPAPITGESLDAWEAGA